MSEEVIAQREAERMRLFCEVYIEAFRARNLMYTEGTYARKALDEFDKAFPVTPSPATLDSGSWSGENGAG